MKKNGHSDEDIAQTFVQRTGADIGHARRTIGDKNRNHVFMTTGIKKGRWHISESHCLACLRYGVSIHPIAKEYAMTKDWGKRVFGKVGN